MDSPRPVQLLVSIVNYRSASLTIECLATLAPELAAIGHARAIVVDNASGDGSAERIAAAITARGWSGWATLIPAASNGGFAAGNNAAIRACRGAGTNFEYVLLLNPDTLVRPGSIRALLDFMRAHPDVGIAGGQCEAPDGLPQVSAFRFHNLVGEMLGYIRLGALDQLFERHLVRLPIQREPVRVDWVTGAHMMVRAEVFDRIGLLDEGYFLYFEETDFILRARRAGFTCWHVPTSRVMHYIGQTSGINRPGTVHGRRPGYWFESRRRYFVLNHGVAYAVATDLAACAGLALWKLRCLAQGKLNDDPPYFLRDLLRYGVLTRGAAGLRPRSIAP
jgi:hypothetical protein